MILFKILWVIAALTTLVMLYFLFVGFADGTVNERNLILWMGIVGFCAAALPGSPWLRSHNHPGLGLILIATVAVPAFLFTLFFLVLILSGAKWN
jgi:hypothetical protein